MSTTERGLIWALFVIFIAVMGWLLATVSINSSRISVLEARTANHIHQMEKLEDLVKEHRDATEHK